MRRIVGIASAALMVVPLTIGTASVAGATPNHASGGSPEVGGDEGPLGMSGIDRDKGNKKKAGSKGEGREQGSSVAGIGPGDNPVEEGDDSVPDTNGLSTEDSPVGGDGPLGGDGPVNGPAR